MSNNTNEQDSPKLSNSNTTEKENNTNDKINSSSPINIPPVTNPELEAINKKIKIPRNHPQKKLILKLKYLKEKISITMMIQMI